MVQKRHIQSYVCLFRDILCSKQCCLQFVVIMNSQWIPICWNWFSVFVSTHSTPLVCIRAQLDWLDLRCGKSSPTVWAISPSVNTIETLAFQPMSASCNPFSSTACHQSVGGGHPAMAYLKSNPYAMNGIAGLTSSGSVDLLHPNVGYPGEYLSFIYRSDDSCHRLSADYICRTHP